MTSVRLHDWRGEEVDGLGIQSTVSINFYDLGKYFSEQSSDDQAQFLMDMAEGKVAP